MDLESAQNNALAKLPLLKQGDYDTWRLRIESYIQLQDYALWEIIEDGNSFKPVARTTTNADGTSTSTIPGAVTAEEKIQKKNDLKARSILMMTLPSEHLLTFNQYKDAKTLFEAIEARFGGNEATKKTQKTLLKQMYENFNASSSESLDSIFTRLQKIVSQLAILGENISQEDLNFKFLRSLPSEWSMHVVVWRNKPDLGSISFDDLYNNFKIVEQEVKRSVISSSNSSSQNVAFVSTPSSTNDVNTSNVHVSTASSSLSTASTTDNTARLNDLEEIDLKWQLALLSMKARKFHQRTGKKIIINGSDTAGYDKTKVECFNCHKMGHFARECRNPRSQEYRSRNQDSSRKTVNVEESSSKAMLAIDGVGFDWSFMTEEKTPTNFALMAFSDSKVHNNKTCTKTCLKSFEDLKSQYDNLRIELNKSEFDLANYKRSLASVEEQLVFYKKNEGMLCAQIAVLKRDALFNESEINALKIQIERLKKEKESNQIKIDNFENASKSLDKLIGYQISDNNRKGVGYNAVPPPPTGLFAPSTIDLSNSGLEEFKQPEFEGYGVKVNKSVSENYSNEIKKTSGAPIIEDWISDCDEDETLKKVLESANVQKPKQADQPRKISQNPRNNSTNLNTPMSKKLGVGFQFTQKACFVYGSFNHLIKDCDFHDKKMVQKLVLNNVKKGTGQREVRPGWNSAMRTNHQNFSNSRRNFAPTAVLTKSGLVPISTARQSSSRAAASVSTVRPIKTAAPKSFVNVAKTRPNAFQKLHSPSRRPFYQQTALKNRNLNNKVNTVKVNSVNTAKGKRVTSAVGEQGINAVKSKACWVWRPKIKVLDHVSKNNGSYICKQFDYVDPTGLEFKVLVVYHTTNGHQFTMSNRQERIGYSRANDNWISKIDCLLSSKVLFEGRLMMFIMHSSMIEKFVTSDKKCQPHRKIKRGQDTKVPQFGGPLDKGLWLAASNSPHDIHLSGSLEQDLKQTKQVYGKALTKLVKKVKHLEDQLKSTTKRRKAKIHAEEGDSFDRFTLCFEKTFKSYTRRRSTDSLKVSTAGDLFSTAEKFLRFDREDLVALRSLVKERFRSAEPTEDMKKALWVELKRLFEPDKDDVLWKLQRYIYCQLQLWH
ncbi:ribonuclease H-like domain-containing protein [Tanacetum coccineum]|uniref:Ribonuclease H-like domain-containing protein n=1 Tax=Tanacetum coccineum TaxID=301880 RepID=A0ABQ5BTU7_9ASTR